jgi:hypothetical protein
MLGVLQPDVVALTESTAVDAVSTTSAGLVPTSAQGRASRYEFLPSTVPPTGGLVFAHVERGDESYASSSGRLSLNLLRLGSAGWQKVATFQVAGSSSVSGAKRNTIPIGRPIPADRLRLPDSALVPINIPAAPVGSRFRFRDSELLVVEGASLVGYRQPSLVGKSCFEVSAAVLKTTVWRWEENAWQRLSSGPRTCIDLGPGLYRATKSGGSVIQYFAEGFLDVSPTS